MAERTITQIELRCELDDCEWITRTEYRAWQMYFSRIHMKQMHPDFPSPVKESEVATP